MTFLTRSITLGNELMDKFGKLAPKPIVGAAGRFLFWPIAMTQYGMYKLGLLNWYSLVYPHNELTMHSPFAKDFKGRVLLGALPWPAHTRETLLSKEKVSAVLNMVSEKNIEFAVEKRMDVPLTDFMHPSFSQLLPAVTFLDECVREGRTVYVHCRAGKGRSATVVMCWFVSRFQLSPETAQDFLSRVRPQILGSLKNRDVVKQFSEFRFSG